MKAHLNLIVQTRQEGELAKMQNETLNKISSTVRQEMIEELWMVIKRLNSPETFEQIQMMNIFFNK